MRHVVFSSTHTLHDYEEFESSADAERILSRCGLGCHRVVIDGRDIKVAQYAPGTTPAMRADTERRIASRTHPAFQLPSVKPAVASDEPASTEPPREPAPAKAEPPLAKLYTVGGKTYTFEEWATVLGVAKNTLHYRRQKTGSVETAIEYYRALSVLPGRGKSRSSPPTPRKAKPALKAALARKAAPSTATTTAPTTAPTSELLQLTQALERHGSIAKLIALADAAHAFLRTVEAA